jgi:hypothetical protein
MDSAFTSVSVFRMLMRNGCDGVGSVKFPFAGVPQALLWNKKDLKKKSGPRVQPGDCLPVHLRSLTDDRALGVQQVMVGPPLASPPPAHATSVPSTCGCMLHLFDVGGRQCRLQDNTVCTFLTTVHTVYSGTALWRWRWRQRRWRERWWHWKPGPEVRGGCVGRVIEMNAVIDHKHTVL